MAVGSTAIAEPAADSDAELRKQIEILREQRDLSRARHLAGGHKPAIEVDDLRWLLDKEENGGNTAIAAANEETEELRAAEEVVTKLRIAHGTLKNQTLRRSKKLEAMEEELRLLLQSNAETPGDRKFASESSARHEATLARVLQMEQLADEQVEYTLTLNMLIKRLLTEKGGGEEMIAQVRQKMSEYDTKADRQLIANNGIVHAGWQARNVTSLQLSLNESGRRTRQMLLSKRNNLVDKAKGDKAAHESEMSEQREAMRAAADAEDAEEIAKFSARILQQQQAAGRLRRLEEQFRRVQELMGFADMDAVVERVVEQKEAGERMEQLKTETIDRHEGLVEEKARLDLAYEEQLGGVDSELTKRRHEYDEFVRAEEEHQEAINKRKGRVDELHLTLTKTRIGLSQIDQRLGTVPRLSRLRGKGGTASLEADTDAEGVAGGGAPSAATGGADGAGEGESTLHHTPSFRRRNSQTSMLVPDAVLALAAGGGDELGAVGPAGASAGGLAGGGGAASDQPPNSPPAGQQEHIGQLEAMREHEIYMVRTISTVEAELVELLHEIEKASTRAAHAAAAGHPIPSFSAGGGMQAQQQALGSPGLESGILGGMMSFGGSELLALGGAQGGGASNPFGSNNVRVRSDSPTATVSTDNAIINTFAELNQWRDERTQIRQQALGLLPPAKGAKALEGETPPGLGRRGSSVGGRFPGGDGNMPSSADGSQSARASTSQGRSRGVADGSATDRPFTATAAGSRVSRRRSAENILKSSSQTSVQSSGSAALRGRPGANVPRAPNKPQPHAPSPRTAAASQPGGRGSAPIPRRRVTRE